MHIFINPWEPKNNVVQLQMQELGGIAARVLINQSVRACSPFESKWYNDVTGYNRMVLILLHHCKCFQDFSKLFYEFDIEALICFANSSESLFIR